MIERGLLYLTRSLLSLVDWTIDLFTRTLEGLHRLWGAMPLSAWYRRTLEAADRRLLSGRAYLQAVGARLRCRVAYRQVAAALDERYRRLGGLR